MQTKSKECVEHERDPNVHEEHMRQADACQLQKRRQRDCLAEALCMLAKQAGSMQQRLYESSALSRLLGRGTSECRVQCAEMHDRGTEV